jgi:hypothetical protein
MTTHIEAELPSDHQFRAFLTSVDPVAVRLDRAAHVSDIELRMLAHTREVA